MALYGDNADDDLRVLEREFAVDMSSVPFAKYFPGHFEWRGLILVLLWRSRWADRIRVVYPALTLDMIEQAIARRRWPFD
jgi:hypothetical protein